MKLIAFTLMLALSSQCFALTIDSFKGKITNLTKIDNKEFFISVDSKCKSYSGTYPFNDKIKSCGEKSEKYKVNKDGTFSFKQFKHTGSIFHSDKSITTTVKFQVKDENAINGDKDLLSETFYDDDDTSKLQDKFDNITVFQTPSFKVALESPDVSDWETRNISKVELSTSVLDPKNGKSLLYLSQPLSGPLTIDRLKSKGFPKEITYQTRLNASTDGTSGDLNIKVRLEYKSKFKNAKDLKEVTLPASSIGQDSIMTVSLDNYTEIDEAINANNIISKALSGTFEGKLKLFFNYDDYFDKFSAGNNFSYEYDYVLEMETIDYKHFGAMKLFKDGTFVSEIKLNKRPTVCNNGNFYFNFNDPTFPRPLSLKIDSTIEKLIEGGEFVITHGHQKTVGLLTFKKKNN